MSKELNYFLFCVQNIADSISPDKIEELVSELVALRFRNGRLFIIGCGGSLANASHAAADFRRLAGIQAYSPDNLAEITAATNDDGWEATFGNWLISNNIHSRDALMVFSVGGGSLSPSISPNIVVANQLAKARGMKIFGIVGPDGGHTAEVGDVVIKIPAPPEFKTPISEAFQAVIWHALVSHPKLAIAKGKWESLQ